MNNKIVFLDIDGTIFDNENDIVHQSTIDAIIKLKQNNVFVCIASGRSKVMGDEVFKRFNLEFDGYVLINGQYVLFQDEVIYKNPLEKKFIKNFIEECDKHNLPYGFLTAEGTFVSSYDERVVKAFDDFKIKLPKLIESDDLEKEIYQCLFFDVDSINYFSHKFGQYVKFINWLGKGADIIPVDSSKAVGIQKICERMNIKRENVFAFGDSTNDIEMIKYANVGIAMGNAKDEVKEVADYVTDEISKDGLSKALKRYNLI